MLDFGAIAEKTKQSVFRGSDCSGPDSIGKLAMTFPEGKLPFMLGLDHRGGIPDTTQRPAVIHSRKPPGPIEEPERQKNRRIDQMKSRTLTIIVAAIALLALVLTACASPSSTTTSSPPATGSTTTSTTAAPTQAAATGSLEVRVTDAPPSAEVTSVMVTVSGVEIHQAGLAAQQSTSTSTSASTSTSGGQTSVPASTAENGWIPMTLSGASTFDLLKVKGLEQVLATGDLAAGTYTQIRMTITKVQVTLQGGQPQDATLPSGKLLFVEPFDVVAGKATVLLFDFDAARSVIVTGGNGNSGGKIIFKPVIRLSVTRTPGALEITTPSLPNGEVGVAYNAMLAAMGGNAPYSWSILTGTLPAGLSLDAATGAISGTPTAAGDSTFKVQAQDASATKKSGARSFTVNIAAAGALQITTTSLPGGAVNAAYTASVQAVGGTAPYSWSVSAGILPAGLTLDAGTGAISGTPTADGDFTFTVKATDSAATPGNDTQALTLHIDKYATQ